MSGGMTNDALVLSYDVESAVEKKGAVMTYGAAVGGTDLAGATDVVMGFAFGNSKNRITGTPESGVKIGIIAPVPGLEIEVPLAADNAQIAYKDPICIDDGGSGLCNMRDGATQVGRRVGYALEAKAAGDGTYVKIRVDVDSVDN